jgi:enoyl-CoA hydratase/carnithine racemase
MQQAYRVLRIVAEAQTIRIVLTAHPDASMLRELRTACAGLNSESGSGIKAVVLDFTPGSTQAQGKGPTAPSIAQGEIEKTIAALHTVAQPVLAVMRATPSPAASALVHVADLTLVTNDATLVLPAVGSEEETLTGRQAARLGYVTYSAPTNEINKEMERILDSLRAKSALALRAAKASVRLAQKHHATHLEALKRVNDFYLTTVMQSHDAHEGLQAFLEKRTPEWKNA